MKYLINMDKESNKAHLWDDGDTYCKMYSTNGLIKKKYKTYDNTQDREICLMCQNVWAEIHEFTGNQYDKL
jgi:hypothetical protein